MLTPLDPTSPRPLYRQLSDQLIQRIEAGTLPPGTRLPGTRACAQRLGVNRNTVVAGYEDAELQGYLTKRPGSGTYVSDTLPVRLARPAPPSAGFGSWGTWRRVGCGHRCEGSG